jgi:hypothetical protein
MTADEELLRAGLATLADGHAWADPALWTIVAASGLFGRRLHIRSDRLGREALVRRDEAGRAIFQPIEAPGGDVPPLPPDPGLMACDVEALRAMLDDEDVVVRTRAVARAVATEDELVWLARRRLCPVEAVCGEAPAPLLPFVHALRRRWNARLGHLTANSIHL